MRESGMPEALDVSCPCCGALLKVDPETGAVVWADKKKAPAKNFDELVSRVASQKDVLEDKFARSVAQTRNQKDILEKKFEEAKKRAAADPTGRPPNPFDNE
jgi:molecular chaperone GrpE (heat shock protein)